MKSLFLLLPIFLFLFFTPFLSFSADSSIDTIAIRVFDNPRHYSALKWYQDKKFNGSPQSLIIDGYEAIRDGRTVYINAANISGTNLFTNIYLISYNQDSENETIDIFNQVLSHWKFNSNLTSIGYCSKTVQACLYDTDCPIGEYCNSLKAKITRDVKRLSDLAGIDILLEEYKSQNGYYPKLNSGSYLAHNTISVWPSWDKVLSQYLGGSLPRDPINKLGDCGDQRFNQITCWDEKAKEFAADLRASILPSQSRVYLYQTETNGRSKKICAQMETSYANLEPFNCFYDRMPNKSPVIQAANLTGQASAEFNGYVQAVDLDGDPISLVVDLLNPSASGNVWVNNYNWQWDAGLNNFSIREVTLNNWLVHAVRAGRVSDINDFYQVRVTADDGQGEPNSQVSRIFNISLYPFPMTLVRADRTLVIGASDTITVSGTDGSRQPLQEIFFTRATFNNAPIDQAALVSQGFNLVPGTMNLSISSTPLQRTGNYIIYIYAQDPNMPSLRIESNITCSIVNNPPVIVDLTATFANNTSQTCAGISPCSVVIDNGEAATVIIRGADPDNHNITYALTNNFGGALTINPLSGVITGFEQLNYENLSDQSYTINVNMSDNFCGNSSQSECSSDYSFNLTVQKYCSISDLNSTNEFFLSDIYTVNNSGDAISLNTIHSCSEMVLSSANVEFIGIPKNQEIVLVSDLSKSMDVNVYGAPAINQLKVALAGDGGLLDLFYNIAINFPASYSIKIGLLGYNSVIVSSQSLTDIVLPGRLNILKNTINSYSTDFQTDTLIALNSAELMFLASMATATDKNIILMSDGLPAVDYIRSDFQFCVTIPNYCPQCGIWPACVDRVDHNCNPVTQWDSCYGCYDYICQCGGIYPNCNLGVTCGPCGRLDCTTCAPDTCSSSFNNFFKSPFAFIDILKPKPAYAVTTRTQCIAQGNCYSSVCQPYQYAQCSYIRVLNCDISNDVNAQATLIKSMNISLYTVYYNTSGTLNPAQRMCDWSSNNGINCQNNTYAFSGMDISQMINNVVNRVISKPKDVSVNGAIITDNQPTAISNTVSGASINSPINCSEGSVNVTFNDVGSLIFSNIRLNYCPSRLH